MKKKELIQRSYCFDIRAEDTEEGNIIIGRPIVYDSVTDLGFCLEVIEKGALDECDLTDVRFLVNHDTSKIPLARSRRNNENSTMRLIVDEKGMQIKVKLDTENNSEARNLYSAIKRGDISGMSFMFSIDDEEWTDLETEKPTHCIRGIFSVVECSAVTFPAYEDTEIYARDKNNLEKLRKTLESRKKRVKPLENGKKTEPEVRALLKLYKKEKKK